MIAGKKLLRERGLEMLHPSDLTSLRESGLTNESIRANELRTVADESEILTSLRCSKLPFIGSALAFQYRELTGELNCFTRYRPHHPRLDNREKKVKYESPRDVPSRAYFPKNSIEKLNDGESPIFITEGEKKAIVLSQLGKAAMGLVGVYGWKVGSHERLIDDLASITWKGRIVYIVFDGESSSDTRRDVEAAAKRLSMLLKEHGCPGVFWIELPLLGNEIN